MNKITSLFAGGVALLMLLSACAADDETQEPLKGLYMVGRAKDADGYNQPGYWDKDGVWTGAPATMAGLVNGAILNQSIYISGSLNQDADTAAFFWKAGDAAITTLDTGSIYTAAVGLAAYGGSVYVAGSYHTDTYFACYWKDGVRVPLSEDFSFAHSAVVFPAGAGMDVYIIGRLFEVSWKSGYWKNGNWVELTGSNVNAQPRSLFRDGTMLYIAAGSGFGYWTLDTAADTQNWVAIADSRNVANLRLIDGDVYAVGSYQATEAPWGRACYWINGTRTILEVDRDSIVYDVVEYEGSVYMAGEADGRACYWKDGERVFLSEDTATSVYRLLRP